MRGLALSEAHCLVKLDRSESREHGREHAASGFNERVLFRRIDCVRRLALALCSLVT